MWPNPQFPADLITFTEEILNGKLYFSCSERDKKIKVETTIKHICSHLFPTIYYTNQSWRAKLLITPRHTLFHQTTAGHGIHTPSNAQSCA